MRGGDLTRGALTGLEVVDLSRVLAGPLCTQDEHADEILTEAGFDPATVDWEVPTDAVR
jgi:crotonobetainyl-CoA:carnitine CoA-transferase CaiB-like acyl-CoA transferase